MLCTHGQYHFTFQMTSVNICHWIFTIWLMFLCVRHSARIWITACWSWIQRPSLVQRKYNCFRRLSDLNLNSFFLTLYVITYVYICIIFISAASFLDDSHTINIDLFLHRSRRLKHFLELSELMTGVVGSFWNPATRLNSWMILIMEPNLDI